MIDIMLDDGGRAASGRKGSAGDCVTRAAAILTGRPYDEMYRLVAQFNRDHERTRSARNGVKTKLVPKLYGDLGLVKVKLPAGPRPTYTEAHARYGDCIVGTRKHVCAIVGGALRDTFDGRFYYWNSYTGRKTESDDPEAELRERKAMSVWVLPGNPVVRPAEPVVEDEDTLRRNPPAERARIAAEDAALSADWEGWS